MSVYTCKYIFFQVIRSKIVAIFIVESIVDRFDLIFRLSYQLLRFFLLFRVWNLKVLDIFDDASYVV